MKITSKLKIPKIITSQLKSYFDDIIALLPNINFQLDLYLKIKYKIFLVILEEALAQKYN